MKLLLPLGGGGSYCKRSPPKLISTFEVYLKNGLLLTDRMWLIEWCDVIFVILPTDKGKKILQLLYDKSSNRAYKVASYIICLLRELENISEPLNCYSEFLLTRVHPRGHQD